LVSKKAFSLYDAQGIVFDNGDDILSIDLKATGHKEFRH